MERMLKHFYGTAVNVVRIEADAEEPNGCVYLYEKGSFRLSPNKLKLIRDIIDADSDMLNLLTKYHNEARTNTISINS